MSDCPIGARTILIVDDVPENLAAYHVILEDLPGIQLVERHSGFEALEYLLDNRVSLVLLDVKMPDINGFEVAEQMRDNPRTRDVPILFISAAHKDEADFMRGFEAGGIDYITKPINKLLLLRKVQKLLELTLSREQLAMQTALLAELDLKVEMQGKELEMREAALRRSKEGLDQMSLVLSREFFKPVNDALAGLLGLQRCVQETLEPEGWRQIHGVYSNLRNMERMLGSVLDFNNAMSKEMEKDCLDPSECAGEAWKMLADLVADEGAMMHCEPLPPVMADKILLRAVFLNMFRNSIQYRKKDAPVIRVLGEWLEDGFVKISIRDNCSGIPLGEQEKVFDLYHRGDPVGEGYDSSGGGLGIGLYLCRQIVARHGGEAGMVSAEGQGSVFWFTLPLAQVERAARPSNWKAGEGSPQS